VPSIRSKLSDTGTVVTVMVWAPTDNVAERAAAPVLAAAL
jgi:hypothetical protein